MVRFQHTTYISNNLNPIYCMCVVDINMRLRKLIYTYIGYTVFLELLLRKQFKILIKIQSHTMYIHVYTVSV